MAIERVQMAKPTQRILHARGLHETRTNISLRILVSNCLKRSFSLQTHMWIALSTGSLDCIAEPERCNRRNLTVHGNSVHYKNVEDQRMQIERHMKVEIEDAERKGHEREEKVKIDLKVDSDRDNFIEMMM